MRNRFESAFLIAASLVASFVALASATSAGAPKQLEFPYGQHSTGVKIVAKMHSAESNVDHYGISGPDGLEGDAMLLPAASSEVSNNLIETQIVGVQSTFRNMTAPYSGAITAEVECTTRKFVRENVVPFQGKQSRVMLAVSNGRRVIGCCPQEDIKYAAVVWAAYDEKRKKVVVIKLFKPVSSSQEVQKTQTGLLESLRNILSL